MGNAAGKQYDAIDLIETTIHNAGGIPALVTATTGSSFEAKKTAMTKQNWTFSSTPATSLEQVKRINPEKYVFLNEDGETVAVLACTSRRLGGPTFSVFAKTPAFDGQELADVETLVKIEEEEGAKLYPFGEIVVKSVNSATYSVLTSTADMKEVYHIKKIGMMKFRAVVESAGEEGVLVAKAAQANLIGSKGTMEVSKGCDLFGVCSLIILLINTNQQVGAGGAAGAGAF